MKRESLIFIWVHVLASAFCVYYVFDLFTLIYDDSFPDAITPQDAADSSGKPAVIPKIIHQTYINETIPEVWQEGQKQCVNLHEGYQYILWTDEMSRQFIQEEYPWFSPTFDSYKYNIERADVIRYFVLYHYGGFYIDLDDACQRPLDESLVYNAVVRKTIPTGISNDVMGAVPGHPFFRKVIDNSESYNRNWLVPYITIMYSTGPSFLSVMWKQFKRWGSPEEYRIRIIFPDDYKNTANAFFRETPGSSWHLSDAKSIKSMGQHIFFVTVLGFLVGFCILGSEYLFYMLLSGPYIRRAWRSVSSVCLRAGARLGVTRADASECDNSPLPRYKQLTSEDPSEGKLGDTTRSRGVSPSQPESICLENLSGKEDSKSSSPVRERANFFSRYKKRLRKDSNIITPNHVMGTDNSVISYVDEQANGGEDLEKGVGAGSAR